MTITLRFGWTFVVGELVVFVLLLSYPNWFGLGDWKGKMVLPIVGAFLYLLCSFGVGWRQMDLARKQLEGKQTEYNQENEKRKNFLSQATQASLADMLRNAHHIPQSHPTEFASSSQGGNNNNHNNKHNHHHHHHHNNNNHNNHNHSNHNFQTVREQFRVPTEHQTQIGGGTNIHTQQPLQANEQRINKQIDNARASARELLREMSQIPSFDIEKLLIERQLSELLAWSGDLTKRPSQTDKTMNDKIVLRYRLWMVVYHGAIYLFSIVAVPQKWLPLCFAIFAPTLMLFLESWKLHEPPEADKPTSFEPFLRLGAQKKSKSSII